MIAFASRQIGRLAAILLVASVVTTGTLAIAQSPIGTSAIRAALTRGGGATSGQARADGSTAAAPAPGDGSAAAAQRGRGPAAGDVAPAGAPDGGPGEGGRLLPNVRAGMPELLRAAGTMGVMVLLVTLVLGWRTTMRRRSRAAPVALDATRKDRARAA